MTKKKESIVEKAEKTVESIAENVKESVERVVESIDEVAKKAEKNLEKAVEVVKEIVESKEENLEKKKRTAKKPEGNESKVLDVEDKKAKLAKLLEKAKKLESRVEEAKEIDLKKLKNEEEEKKDTLVPMEDYLKASIHLGTRVITPDMRKYVYRRRADGLAVFNTALLDDKLREGAAYLAKFASQDVILVCKREAGWRAAKKFSETTGIRCFLKKYPAGVLTNTNLENFFETQLVFICDPWLDKNALMDANRIGIPVLSVCDTNNFTAGVTQIIPGNNKSAKSLGIVFYLLTKLYVEARKIDKPLPSIQEFIEGWDELQPPK